MRPAESEGKRNAFGTQKQLERILQSPGFSRNERISRFLRFVVEGHLEGKDNELKESLIAIEVFGRKPDYDPKLDAIVRTNATRLRACLAEYYVGEGREDPIRIELPKGGYVPVISQQSEGSKQPLPHGRGSEGGFGSRLALLWHWHWRWLARLCWCSTGEASRSGSQFCRSKTWDMIRRTIISSMALPQRSSETCL